MYKDHDIMLPGNVTLHFLNFLNTQQRIYYNDKLEAVYDNNHAKDDDRTEMIWHNTFFTVPGECSSIDSASIRQKMTSSKGRSETLGVMWRTQNVC